MSRFLTEDLDRTDNAGAVSDVFTRNALACAGTGGLVGLGAGSVMVVAAALPAQVFGGAAVCGGLIYAGNRIADGKSVNPFAKEDAAPKQEASVTEAAA